MTSGIDAIGFALPDAYLALSDLALARGVPPEKFTDGLGTTSMAVAGPDDDTVTLATRAAADALERGGISAADIGLVVVGTETAVDHSKPVASFVQGNLGIPSGARVFETKHACYGGTAGLMAALDWIDAGRSNGKKALVVCADIARYGLFTPGEPTQGAGAVAMVVGEDPRLVRLDGARTGRFSRDVFDFWRPLDSKDARVDGRYSVECYLEAVRGAYSAFRADDIGPSPDHVIHAATERFGAMLYHVPYGKMARKAHSALVALDRDLDRDLDRSHDQGRDHDRDMRPDESFARLVAPSLRLPAVVGNVYTASLYLALLGLLSSDGERLAGQAISLFSYGSGSCAELFVGQIVPGAHLPLANVFDLVGRRQRLDVAAYEERFRERDLREAHATPLDACASRSPRFFGVRDHKRIYA